MDLDHVKKKNNALFFLIPPEITNEMIKMGEELMIDKGRQDVFREKTICKEGCPFGVGMPVCNLQIVQALLWCQADQVLLKPPKVKCNARDV